MGKHDPEWMLRAAGNTSGPHSLVDLVAFARSAASISGAEVFHEHHTKGRWIAATKIKPIVTAFADRPVPLAQVQPVAPQTTIVQPSQGVSPGLAAVLSFLFPGLGQLCQGRVALGLLIIPCTLIGYVPFIVPGLVLHLASVVDAALYRG
jgi:TM2 domain-containing membrane protein YozV